MSATTIVVNDENPRRQYTATGGQTVFDFPVPFFKEADLTVYLTPNGNTPNDTNDLLTITTDYTVNGENTQDGGEIVLTSGATAGDIVTIERIVPIARTSDYQTSGDLLAETLNTEQDTEIFIAQQLRQDIQRAILFGKTSTTQGAQFIGNPSEGKALLWDANGDLINSTDNFNSIVTDAVAAKVAAEAAQTAAETAETNAETAQAASEAAAQETRTIYDNVAAMVAATDLVIGMKVQTAGYSTTGDRGGNLYEIVAAATGTDDGGSFIDLTGSSLQAKALFPYGLNVKQFGAAGSPGTDSTSEIQAAIDYCESLIAVNIRAPEIYFPPGVYDVSATITIQEDGINLYGDGERHVRILRDTDYGSTFQFSHSGTAAESIDNVGIRGMTIEHSIATVGMTSGAAIEVQGANGCKIKDIYFIYPYRGIWIRGGVDYDIERIDMLGTYISADPIRANLAGIHLTEAPAGAGGSVVDLATRVRMRSVHIGGALQASFLYGFLLHAYEEVQLSQFHVAHAQYNMFFSQNAEDKAMLDFFASDGYLDACGLFNVYMVGSTATGNFYIGETYFSNVEIKANTYGNQGFYVDGTARGGTHTQAVQGLYLSNVTAIAHQQHGFNFDGGRNIHVTNCCAKGNSLNGSGNFDGLRIGANAEAVSVNGGAFGKNAESNAAGLQRYGINISSGATEIAIQGANLEGNVTAPLLDNSNDVTNRFHQNIGYVPGIIAPSPTIPASGGTYTNDSGHLCWVSVFGGTVSNITVNGTTFASATPARFNVPAGGTVTMTYTVAPSWIWWRL